MGGLLNVHCVNKKRRLFPDEKDAFVQYPFNSLIHTPLCESKIYNFAVFLVLLNNNVKSVY